MSDGLRWRVWLCVLVVIGGAFGPGCRRREARSVMVLGSTSIQPFAELLAEEFNQRHSDGSQVQVQGGGSAAGLQGASSGIADIGACSRELNDAERKDFTRILIARDGLAVIVHRDNPVSGLSLRQIRDLFSGSLTHWSAVGGRAEPVRLISREEGSGTREAFTNLVMGHTRVSRKALTQESNGAVKELVRNDRCAIGYMSLGLAGSEVKVLLVDGVHPSAETVGDGRYPLVRPFLFVLAHPPRPAAQEYIDFVLSDRGQAMLEKEGLIRARSASQPASASRPASQAEDRP